MPVRPRQLGISSKISRAPWREQEARTCGQKVGGGASPDRVAKAFKLVLSDGNVKAILVNIFAGINRCDWVAQGVVQAVRDIGIKVPLVVRLAGTNETEGRRIITDSGLPIISAETLADAARKSVAAARSVAGAGTSP